VSGGADSVALLDLLAAEGRWRLQAWHLDHRLRPDSAADAALVARLAASLGIPCHLEDAEIAVLARTWHCGLEAAGRRERYRRLAACAQAVGAVAVATAHHRDDQTETVLLNLLRGAGARGLAGMPAQRPLAPGIRLIRPVLLWSRAELRAHARYRNLSWHEDTSNDDPRFARNQLRHAVLPDWETACPGLGAALAESATRQRLLVESTAVQAEALWAGSADAGLPVAAWRSASAPVRALAWMRLLAELGVEPTRGRLRRLEALAAAAPGARLHLGGWLLARHRGEIIWSPARPPAAAAIGIPGPGEYRRGGWRLLITAGAGNGHPQAGPWTGLCDPVRLVPPVIWRELRDGERWRPLGAPGSQTVRDTLAKRGIPALDRGAAGLLADGEGPVWVPGAGPAERVRVADGAAWHLAFTSSDAARSPGRGRAAGS
jgi:tRNA(Ile)-lysidine synthase